MAENHAEIDDNFMQKNGLLLSKAIASWNADFYVKIDAKMDLELFTSLKLFETLLMTGTRYYGKHAIQPPRQTKSKCGLHEMWDSSKQSESFVPSACRLSSLWSLEINRAY
uniref:Uncharacterized protein n=1 Tax=Physcomitrium patens TaxID=3218 RepID=A0A2K1IJV0_PHYPA|nr:hypothetical protein PHYPA_028247 [Physcomitrium patens]